MIRVERLRIRLPAGFEARGESIARLVGRSLAELSPTVRGHRDAVTVPPVSVQPADDDARIADTIGRAFVRELPVSREQGPGA